MSIDKKKNKKFIGISAAVIGVVFVGMSILAGKKKPSSIYEDDKEQKNPFEGKKVVFIEDENDKENGDGVKGHLEAIGDSEYNAGIYEKYVKRAIDVVLSFGGLIVFSPIFLTIAIAIKIDDPGPVLFTQKRVGRNKKYFKLHKFRTMKMVTPHDVPTHMLDNPEQYITRVGKFLRAHSLDELPQIWDVFIGNMCLVGPRPALWNQDLLTAERDKYSANDIRPGLTGWAQINGRDELKIKEKARLDGEYCENIGLGMDVKVFLESLGVFVGDDSVVEGGTGEMEKKIDLSLFENEKEVTVSIVTYNSKKEIDILMKSLEANNFFDHMTVYVIDNASSDGTADYIIENYSWARVIASKENLGFGKGHNLVIKNIHSKFHIIVNPDIFVPKNTISEAIYFISMHDDIAVMTPFVMNTDGTQQFLPKKKSINEIYDWRYVRN